MPSPAAVHVNSPLSTFASGYVPPGAIADELVPVIPVTKRSDTYFQRTRKDVSTVLDATIGPNGTVSEADFDVTPATYNVRDFGLMGKVSQEEIDNADEPMKPKEMRLQNLMFRLMLDREVRVAAVVDASGSYAANAAATAAWSAVGTSNPIKDVQDAIARIAPGGDTQTELVMGLALETWQALSRHPDLLGLRAGGGGEKGVMRPDEIAAALGLDRIVVSSMQKNTANRALTASYSRVWSTTIARIIRRPKGQPSGADAMCFAGTFRKNVNGPEGWRVTEWDMPQYGVSGGVGIKVSVSEDAAKILQNDMGTLITGVL